MKKLKKELLNNHFSHIYIEKDVFENKITKEILNKLPNREIILINHYKDLFNRTHQDFNIQKQSTSLILAQKKDKLIYKGARVCQDFGNENFYYTSNIMNCIYNCEYCYLQGMYPSANIVVFVNIEDFFSDVKNVIKEEPAYFCVSYDTDMLALENILGFSEKWMIFTKDNKRLTMELRTKSANYESISHISSHENIILAWTLSPEEIISEFEHKAPSLDKRIESIKAASSDGWKIRLCIDPILFTDNWKEHYERLLTKIFTEISKDSILDVSIGTFRISKDYLKNLRKKLPTSKLINYPFSLNEGIYSYDEKLSLEMIQTLKIGLEKFIDSTKIYI